jgi:hypothetical protein
MANFDIKTFLELRGLGQGDIFTAAGSSFGMPSCLLNLTRDALSLLPTKILTDMLGMTDAAKAKADEQIKKHFKRLMMLTSIMEFSTENGIFKFISDASLFGIDADEAGRGNAVSTFFSVLDNASKLGGRIYKNIEFAKNKIDSIKDCFQKYDDILRFQGSRAAEQRETLQTINVGKAEELINIQYGVAKEQIQSAGDFIDATNALSIGIVGVLSDRAANPALEPQFVLSLSSTVSGLGFEVAPDPLQEEEEEELLRLVFGPPKSFSGKFLLSQDGLYYDSQTSGLIPVLNSLKRKADKLDPALRWKFEHDPNIGGRGDKISSDEVLDYVGTLFDPDILDDSVQLQNYYDADRLLNVLIGQKDKRIYDLSAHVTAFEGSGASTAIITNTRQSILSEGALFDSKIKKRKKQIEVAVKAPSIFGDGPKFKVGEIPVNDFSYLQDINLSVDLDKQRGLVLDQDDVSTVVKPLPPKFVFSPSVSKDTNADHLLIPGVGKGSIIYDDGDPEVVSGTKLAVTDVVTLEDIIAMYNFLRTDVVGATSEKFVTQNDAGNSNTNNAQLVGSDLIEMFNHGLAIPELHGITQLSTDDPNFASGTGSYVRLPDTKDFQDLMYSRKGFTIESWIHMPFLKSSASGWNDSDDASGLYRIILANENTGLANTASAQTDINNVIADFSDNVTRGFMMGFTRDRRLTKKLNPTNNDMENSPTSSLAFFAAPTQSFDSSTVAFVRKDIGGECVTTDGWRSFVVDTSTTGADGNAKLDDSCSEFVHLALTVDIKKDEMKLYVDAQTLATSSVSEVFGTDRFRPVNLPSFKKPNSFEYSGTVGPSLDTFFTPWIIGGGYTDGLDASGGFMGGDWGGRNSGLRGHVGSVKFYKKPLNSGEVLSNLNAQRELFKNIDMPNTC